MPFELLPAVEGHTSCLTCGCGTRLQHRLPYLQSVNVQDQTLNP